jgi:hypothetical protein
MARSACRLRVERRPTQRRRPSRWTRTTGDGGPARRSAGRSGPGRVGGAQGSWDRRPDLPLTGAIRPLPARVRAVDPVRTRHRAGLRLRPPAPREGRVEPPAAPLRREAGVTDEALAVLVSAAPPTVLVEGGHEVVARTPPAGVTAITHGSSRNRLRAHGAPSVGMGWWRYDCPGRGHSTRLERVGILASASSASSANET